MFSYFNKSEKKFTTRGLFIGAMSRAKLIAETSVCYSFSKVFAENTN